MSTHEYTPGEALNVLLHRLELKSSSLASQVKSAIDAGKDVQEEEPAVRRRKKARRYRKTVPLPEEEALERALDVLQAYFIEQPSFVSSAVENFRPAAVGPPVHLAPGKRDDRGTPKITHAGVDTPKELEVELRAETQITPSAQELQSLDPPDADLLREQRENLGNLRKVIEFKD